MKAFWITLLIGFSFVWAPPSEALSYRQLSPGLEYGTYSFKDSATKLHLLRVDLNQYEVRPILAQDFDKSAMTAKEMAKSAEAVAVINANFFGDQKRPLGLVLRGGEIKNLIHPTYWWASLVIKGKTPRILKIFTPGKAIKFDQGVQAGPRLVIDGKVPRLRREDSPKSAVGIDGQGRLVLIVSQGSLPIRDLARTLANPKSKGGLGLKNALNLDGGSSSQFYIKEGKFEQWIPSLITVPVGLGVFRK